MRRANSQLKIDRRAEILSAAERCFARSGFHRSSMQEICREASMSPGNLYRYFASKEAIIAGICERDRAEAARDFLAVDQAPDFFQGLAALARHHLVEKPAQEVAICAEIMAESRRNPEIARVWRDCEEDVRAQLIAMLHKAAERGEISSDLDFASVTTVLMVLSDGLSWRRAVEPAFDAETVMPIMLQMVQQMLAHPAGRPEEKSIEASNGRRGDMQ